MNDIKRRVDPSEALIKAVDDDASRKRYFSEIGSIKTKKKAEACKRNGNQPKKPNPIKGQAISHRNAGHTLEQTSKEFGVSIATVSRWCRGLYSGS